MIPTPEREREEKRDLPRSNGYLTHFQPTQYLKIIHMCLPGITFKLASPQAIAVAN